MLYEERYGRKKRMLWKRYAIVFGFGLIIANGYTLWPALANSQEVFNCPLFFPTSYQVRGASEVVGPPLYSQMQIVMRPGSTSYETKIIQSSQNNLTQLFQHDPSSSSNPVTQYLYRIDSFDGSLISEAANATGVTITFQNKTFEGFHVANFFYSISVDSSAQDSSYELGEAPCGTGLVLTIGNMPYTGPIWYGEVQLIEIIINNIIALLASTIACIALRFYWIQPKTVR